MNHNPIDVGDNLPPPSSGSPGGFQTWWGFPTWRETLSPFWVDPTYQVNTSKPPAQPPVLPPVQLPMQPTGLAAGTPLPAMTSTYRSNPQPFNDELLTTSNVFFPLNGGVPPALWSQYSWEDDLVMTGVRSFDIKAYDNSLAAYADLGWGDDLRNYPLNISQNPNNQTNLPFLNGTPNTNLIGNPGFTDLTPYLLWNNQWVDLINQTFAHEGRMPPLVEDNRYDAQFGAVPAGYYGTAYPNYTSNIGDDNPAVVRLRRVWDSWSTEYTQAPGTGVYLNKGNANDPLNGFPWGPPYTPPIYPVVPAALPGTTAGHPDPDPRDRPDQSTCQDIDHPTGFHGQVVAGG